jgi:hypothetical protein
MFQSPQFSSGCLEVTSSNIAIYPRASTSSNGLVLNFMCAPANFDCVLSIQPGVDQLDESHFVADTDITFSAASLAR